MENDSRFIWVEKAIEYILNDSEQVYTSIVNVDNDWFWVKSPFHRLADGRPVRFARLFSPALIGEDKFHKIGRPYIDEPILESKIDMDFYREKRAFQRAFAPEEARLLQEWRKKKIQLREDRRIKECIERNNFFSRWFWIGWWRRLTS